MVKYEKKLNEKEIEKKITDLKLEILKNATKRKSIKREIARLLTMRNQIKLAPKGVSVKGKENK